MVAQFHIDIDFFFETRSMEIIHSLASDMHLETKEQFCSLLSVPVHFVNDIHWDMECIEVKN